MNPRDWLNFEFSSLHYLCNKYRPDWFRPSRIHAQFKNVDEYVSFLKDYDDKKRELAVTKYLADVV